MNEKHIYGLIGKTLTHSFSKKYFSQKFLEESLSYCSYNNYELKHINHFPALIKNTISLKGLNVTIPYKTEIIQYLDELDEASKKIGAVNTVKFYDNKLLGFNTDVIGFENSIKPLLKEHHTKALILGTGGAAKAVEFVFEKMGILYLSVSRSKKDNSITYQNLNETILDQYSIIINTTPLGMFPNIESCPAIPYEYIGENHLLYDLVYNPDITTFLKMGKERGTDIKNGLEMLQLQAEASWEIWNNKQLITSR